MSFFCVFVERDGIGIGIGIGSGIRYRIHRVVVGRVAMLFFIDDTIFFIEKIDYDELFPVVS